MLIRILKKMCNKISGPASILAMEKLDVTVWIISLVGILHRIWYEKSSWGA
jgi:hypothetical protein